MNLADSVVCLIAEVRQHDQQSSEFLTILARGFFFTVKQQGGIGMNLSQLPSELQARIIKLQSCEKALFEIDSDTVNMCNTVKQMLKGNGKRSFRNVLGGYDHVLVSSYS